MTQEQKTRIGEHYDRLYSIAIGLTPNIPDDIRNTMRAAYVAGADYALDIYCPQWISVEDELPKQGITYYSEPVIVTDGTIVGIDMYNHQAREWDEVKKPTHWMPLPQPPTCSEKPNNCEKGGNQ